MKESTQNALIQSGASSVNTALAYFGNKKLMEQAERFAREDATTAYNRQRDFLQYEIGLNSPSAQMQRYINAGLNPNLVYDKDGLIGAPSVPQASSASAPSFSPSFEFPLIDAQLKQAQIENLEADSRKKDKDIEWTDADIKRLFKDMDKTDAEIENLKANARYLTGQYDNLQVQADLWRSQTHLYDVEAKAKELENSFNEATLDDRIDLVATQLDIERKKASLIIRSMLATALKDEALANYYNNKAGLTVWEAQLIRTTCGLYATEADYYKAVANYNDLLAQYYPEKTEAEINRMASESFKNYSNSATTIFDMLFDVGMSEEILERTSPNPRGGTDKTTTRTKKPKRVPVWRKIVLRRFGKK